MRSVESYKTIFPVTRSFFLTYVLLAGFLIIQTAFIGDAILATPVIEYLHSQFPHTPIDLLVRKGNEGLFHQHPKLRQTLVWNKKKRKYAHLWELFRYIRRQQYAGVINLQRFGATGALTAFSGAKDRVGFDKNPFSSLFTLSVPHEMGNGKHEVDRNLEILAPIWGQAPPEMRRPRLYPSPKDYQRVKAYQESSYVCMAPASVWYTKQLPATHWVKLMDRISHTDNIYVLGAPSDRTYCEELAQQSLHPNIYPLAGELGLLASAALMERARMNYVNDSAPMHLASAMNAPTVAFFCSTIPQFGFGPLADSSWIVETSTQLTCRPCDLHGKKACPEGHFRCGKEIEMEKIPV